MRVTILDYFFFLSLPKGKTIYLGMDPDVDANEWTDVKHPKRGLVLRVAKPKANTSLFKAILEHRFKTEGGTPEVSESQGILIILNQCNAVNCV